MKHKHCPNYSAGVTGYKKEETNHHTLFRARCKMWNCPYCAPINRRVWLGRIGLEIEKTESKNGWYFWTLTLLGKDHESTAASLKKWRSVWNKFMQAVRRLIKEPMRYIRIFETHKSGSFHVHMLADFSPDDVICKTDDDNRENWTSKKIAKLLKRFKMGWRHDIRPIKQYGEATQAQAVAGYVGKYLTKSVQGAVRDDLKNSGMGKIRMIQTSNGWAKTKRQTQEGWTWSVGNITFNQFLKAVESNIEIHDADLNIYLDHNHFRFGEYPNQIIDTITRLDDENDDTDNETL